MRKEGLFSFRKSLKNNEIFEKKKRRARGKKKTAIKNTFYHDFLLEKFAGDLEFRPLWGGKNDEKKKVTITAWIKNTELFLSVEDEGGGFAYAGIPDPTTPKNIMKATGRGLYLIKILSDYLEFQKTAQK